MLAVTPLSRQPGHPKGPAVDNLAVLKHPLCHSQIALAPMGCGAPAQPLGLCIDFHSLYNRGS